MSDPNRKREENKAGEFFVDDQCISCGLCWTEAPEFFRSHDIHTYAYICRQPNSESEKLACQTVLETCPVQAIGKEVPHV